MDEQKQLHERLVYGDALETLKALAISSKEARRSGLLSLEDMLGNAPETPLLVRIGIQLVVDGTEHDTVRDILDNLIAAEALEGEALIEAKVVRTGILCIQQGENPRVLLAKCGAHLGVEDYMRLTNVTMPFCETDESRFELPEDTLFGVPMAEVRAREKLGWKFLRLYRENPEFSAVEYLKNGAEE